MPFVVAALSGILAVLAYPFLVVDGGPGDPAAWWSFPPLILVAYVPLFLVLRREARARRRFLLGWVTGFVHILGMQRWIGGTLVAMSHFPEWGGVVSVAVYAVWAGLPWAIVAVAAPAAQARLGRGPALVVVAAGAALLERHAPVLFPFHTASALFTWPSLLQASEFIGISGLSALVWGLNLALAELIAAPRRAPRAYLPDGLAVAAAIVGLGIGALRSGAPPEGDRTLDVLMVQPNMTTDQKNAEDPHVREGVYKATVAQTLAAVEGGRPDLVIWPEGGFPFTYDDGAGLAAREAARAAGQPVDKPTTRGEFFSRALRQFAKGLGAPFITGSIGRAHDGQGERDTNSAFFFAGDGAPPQRYDKRVLLLFGERVPFADWFPSLRNAVPGMSHHLAGAHPATWTVGGVRLAVTLCYEAIFADFTREALAEDDAEVLLNLTNDVWFGHTVAAAQHLMLQVPRAIESRRWLIRSTNSGISAFVTPAGALRGVTPLSAPALARERLVLGATGPTVYDRVGDWPLVVVALLGLALGWLGRRRAGATG